MLDIRLLTASFDPNPVIDALIAHSPDAGGIATFVGKVRAGGEVEALELSHYEPLTLPNMEELGARTLERFDLMGLVMLHRVGGMNPGEPIVCVSAAARHRRSAIEAVDFCMDHLKSAAWFWKRELRAGEWQWIEPRAQDHTDLSRWGG
ncbi:MAG: molybdenum cofactor biosynthesis protein MoaE [Pseudomonadota bacterium]